MPGGNLHKALGTGVFYCPIEGQKGKTGFFWGGGGVRKRLWEVSPGGAGGGAQDSTQGPFGRLPCQTARLLYIH